MSALFIEEIDELHILIEGFNKQNRHIIMDEPTTEGRIHARMCLQPHVLEWIAENLSPETEAMSGVLCVLMYFVNDRDYTLFKLFWL